MDNVLTIMTVLIPIVTALTALIKQYVNKKYHGLIPLMVGLFIGAAYYTIQPEDIFTLIWAGGLAGLASGGFYSVQNVRNK